MQDDEPQFDTFRVAKLILELRQSGITDHALLNAVERIPREKFVPDHVAEYAYHDAALPIACGQTITQPTAAVSMVHALELGGKRAYTVLEIGTGSGFMTALMARLARRVYTIDRYRTLVENARERFEELGLFNVISQCSDGAKGWPETAPFDRIISSCALESPPEVWFQQLKPGGILIMPVGTNEEQHVVRYRKNTDGSVTEEPLAPSKFLHLIEGVAKQL